MNTTWRALAATGDPNGSGLAHWPEYSRGQIMEFTLHGQKAHPDPRNDRLDVLSAVIDDKS